MVEKTLEPNTKVITEGGFRVAMIADSVNEFGNRLTTMEWTYPRFIHAEIMTHRDRARNAASSRAIPWPKMLERIQNSPVVPIKWGAEQRGMQTGDEIAADLIPEAKFHWMKARDSAIAHANALAKLGVHKSICNRLVEPFMYITVVMTATDWNNLWRLRVHPDAEVHFQKIARMAKDLYDTHKPSPLKFGEWHLPYVSSDEMINDFRMPSSEGFSVDWRKVSVARCARVSYLTHDGKRSIEKDLELFDRLCQGSGFGHWSPHEHVATPATPDVRSGPFRGWIQYRKFFPNECAAG